MHKNKFHFLVSVVLTTVFACFSQPLTQGDGLVFSVGDVSIFSGNNIELHYR
ncbi:hypothetical protein EDC56_2563 [Sinobacterium caligoides]|uniref:Uncharacterized protein n=1 Tax=Sinobacterium caligoides TaxID=933926 RepID=A0A3N2DJQ7_9GAMM|nr:hypothetical protein [Sinobacterium caligoides]ROR99928.1 hypothetical protein EDC56_2563 [Sinobacterium caligoides]